MIPPVQTRTLFENAVREPLGSITLAGMVGNGPGVPESQMRLLGSYALVYVLGEGGRYADALGCRKRLQRGDLVLVFPDVAHSYGPVPGRRWDEIYIVFEGPLFDLWRARHVFGPDAPVFHLEPFESWLRRLQETVEPDLSPLERLCRLQSVLASALTDFQRDPGRARDEEWIAEARELLGADPGEALYVDEVAKRLKMAPETFRKKFARLAGMPPWRYRMTRNIERACKLVHEGRLTNKEIAEKLGFNDEFHFSRRFKQITGRSPTQFRALSPLR